MHRLDPLLRPSSIAIFGASDKPGSYGRGITEACLASGYAGQVYLINPNYPELNGRPCYPDLRALPEIPQHCIIGLANTRLEGALDEAVAAGVEAATIFGSGMLKEERSPPLLDRIKEKARQAGLLICGGNGSGFYNREHKVRCQLGGGAAEPVGSVTLVAQSGSISAALCGNDGRLRFNLTVSSGQEITTSVSDYMDFALSLESTRAIGLFIETIRNPAHFVQMLERAAELDIPVVVNKVGKSEASQRFAVSHSGAMTGNDAVYDAVFARYGVLRVDDPDELVATLQLLSTGRRAARAGKGIVAITDSGGERELLADIAAEQNVPFAPIEPHTRDSLAGRLEYGLEPENPLDAWGTGHGFEAAFEGSMADLLADPNASLGIWVADLRDGVSYHEAYAKAAQRIIRATDKPLAIATCYSKCINTGLANSLREAGVPVLEGMRAAMVASRRALDYAAFREMPAAQVPAGPDPVIVRRWQERCETGAPLDEGESLSLLSDFGVPVVPHRIVSDRAGAVATASALGFPVALKTAMTDIHHKSDVKGVHLALESREGVERAYDDLAKRLGARVLISAMVPPGMEVVFGAVNDQQFGSVVLIGAGGILVEHLRDTQLAVPPLDPATALRIIDRLAVRPLFDGVRGGPPLDVHQLATAFSRFSVMVSALGSNLAEIDVNPLIVNSQGVFAVDGLIVPKTEGA